MANHRMAAPVIGVRREIDRMFDDVFRGITTTNGWTPLVDVRETKTDLMFEADVPGLTARDIEVQTEHNLLTIRGTRTPRLARPGAPAHHYQPGTRTIACVRPITSGPPPPRVRLFVARSPPLYRASRRRRDPHRASRARRRG